MVVRGLLVTISLLCIIYCDPIKDQAKLLYWQWRCLNYANAGQTITFAQSQPPPVIWTKFCAANGVDESGLDARIFLGLMKRPDGGVRLVKVDVRGVFAWNGLEPQDSNWLMDDNFSYSTKKGVDRIEYVNIVVIRPAGIIGNAAEVWDNSIFGADLPYFISLPYNSSKDDLHNTFNGAVLDPANPSHFTIAAHFSDGTSNPIDGYLDDHDKLTITQKVPVMPSATSRPE
jgi:hypothetical protein